MRQETDELYVHGVTKKAHLMITRTSQDIQNIRMGKKKWCAFGSVRDRFHIGFGLDFGFYFGSDSGSVWVLFGFEFRLGLAFFNSE